MAINKKGIGVVKGFSIEPRSVLNGANLDGAALTGANLEDASLAGASLFEAVLDDAVLNGANLDKASVMGTSLRRANLRNAKLRLASADPVPDAMFPRITNIRTCFDEADLTEASLYRAILNVTSFREAKLNSADLTRTRFVMSDLTGAFLEDATLLFTGFYKADLSGAHLNNCMFQSVDMVQLVMKKAEARDTLFVKSNLRNSDLSNTDFTDAVFRDVIFDNAVLTGACFKGAHFRDCTFLETDLTNADFTEADLSDMDLSMAIMTGTILKDTVLQNTTLPEMSIVKRRTYGAMTGAILKLNKPDAPVRAAEFKRVYPTEFEKLKVASLGRDFTPSLKQSIMERYITPFSWLVVPTQYKASGQRKSEKPNEVLILTFNVNELGLTDKVSKAIAHLSRNLSSSSVHPKTKFPRFPVGWIRYSKDDKNKLLFIEEIQSDVDVVRGIDRKQMAVVDADVRAEVASVLKPYADRFYEDAVSLVFEEAKALGYAVEMLGYDDKRGFGSPKSVYIDLPPRMGMRRKETQSDLGLKDKVSYYNPNPSRPKRWRRRGN